MYRPHFIYLFIRQQTGSFCLLVFWIMLSWTRVCRYSYLRLCLIYHEYIPRSGIAGSHGNFVFNFLMNHTVFHCGCTILYSCQQCSEFQFLQILANSCYFHFYFIVAISVDVKCLSRGFDLHFPNGNYTVVLSLFICLMICIFVYCVKK